MLFPVGCESDSDASYCHYEPQERRAARFQRLIQRRADGRDLCVFFGRQIIQAQRQIALGRAVCERVAGVLGQCSDTMSASATQWNAPPAQIPFTAVMTGFHTSWCQAVKWRSQSSTDWR